MAVSRHVFLDKEVTEILHEQKTTTTGVNSKSQMLVRRSALCSVALTDSCGKENFNAAPGSAAGSVNDPTTVYYTFWEN